MWEYVSGTVICPKSIDNDYDKLKHRWNTVNAKIMTWINNSVESSIAILLAKFQNAKDDWDYLAITYSQSNFPRSSMRHRLPLLTVSIVVNELLAKETRLKYLCLMSDSDSSQVFATGSQGLIHVISKPKSKVAMDECNYYHKSACPKSNAN
ncbi:hypothetical protein LWI28_021535 [Acer negundo]|uniref:Uncharacterized protein n=1 Tax=Acer negundo TaxID=4023 RepID=A0AAD5IVY5_ACENE|nr:hypothetical protein LWI28_021535 [Acer negundo]